jgi:hypothetical protein
VIGATNPCGLLAALIRRQLWHYVTASDEDAASTRLKQHLYGKPPQPRSAPQHTTTEPPELSKDAAIVRHLHTELARAGFHGEVFPLVSRQDASWTRERWDNAVRELTQARRAWQRAHDLNRVGSIPALEAYMASGVSSTEDGME